MADITLLGVDYEDVPAVQLPATGGGSATFLEVSGSQNITENDTYNVSTLAQVVVNVAGSGGDTVLTGSVQPSGTGQTTLTISNKPVQFNQPTHYRDHV